MPLLTPLLVQLNMVIRALLVMEKIFVTPLEECIRIRTGERGSDASLKGLVKHKKGVV